ncbi:MAG: radical SAM protein [Nanoarchaeota archaeon]|nr:radical SAM protein [Nanoarchaeota archaeon]
MKKNKILFLKARTGMDDPSPPMSFSFLGRIAEEEGFEVLVENLNAQYNEKTNEDIVELIKKEEPTIVGVHIFTNAAKYSYELMKKIKPYCKLLIVGGPHPTICPEETLEMGADVAFVGEAEISFRKFLKNIKGNKSLKNLKGIVFQDNKKIIKTGKEEVIFDLDKIPIPDKRFNRKSDYIKIKDEINNFGQILSTRGCPGRCTYCFSLFSKCYRYMSAQKVFEEIMDLKKTYGINFINFIDDAFTINKERLIELCDLLMGKNIEWSCATRVDFLNKELIIKMGKAGCKMINFGVESALPETLLKMKKTANPKWYVEHTDNLLKWCYEEKIRVAVNILTGFPWETAEGMKEMQKYINKTKKYVTSGFYGGILQPQPGTEMYTEYAKEYGFEKWWLQKRSIFKDDYRPFFMAYYHQYWDHLQNNFFNFDKDKFREIDKLYKLMGKWNLYIFTKRRFKNPFIIQFIYQGLFLLSNISIILYKLSPRLEKRILERIKKFGYKFKFRKGSEEL